jgi:hypothetical protein
MCAADILPVRTVQYQYAPSIPSNQPVMSAKSPATAAGGAQRPASPDGNPSGASPGGSPSVCTLRRCKGVRGCICPKGRIPVGCYGKSSESPMDNVIVEVSKKLIGSPSKGSVLAGAKGKDREKSVSPMRPKSASGTERKSFVAAIPTNEKSPAKSDAPAKAEAKETSATVSVPTAESKGTAPAVAATPQAAAQEPASAGGEVIIRYNHYKKKFAVNNGIALVSAVDAEYCLSFAYPNSKLHLSETSPAFLAQQDDNSLSSIALVPEDAAGNFLISSITTEYWVHIEEDPKEKAEYEKRQAEYSKEVAERRAKEDADAENGIVKTKTESCSCIEGNPCVDKYCCKDWDNRYAVAKKNGWKGFQ